MPTVVFLFNTISHHCFYVCDSLLVSMEKEDQRRDATLRELFEEEDEQSLLRNGSVRKIEEEGDESEWWTQS